MSSRFLLMLLMTVMLVAFAESINSALPKPVPTLEPMKLSASSQPSKSDHDQAHDEFYNSEKKVETYYKLASTGPSPKGIGH